MNISFHCVDAVPAVLENDRCMELGIEMFADQVKHLFLFRNLNVLLLLEIKQRASVIRGKFNRMRARTAARNQRNCDHHESEATAVCLCK